MFLEQNMLRKKYITIFNKFQNRYFILVSGDQDMIILWT